MAKKKINTAGWTEQEIAQGWAIRKRGGKGVIKLSLNGEITHLSRENKNRQLYRKLNNPTVDKAEKEIKRLDNAKLDEKGIKKLNNKELEYLSKRIKGKDSKKSDELMSEYNRRQENNKPETEEEFYFRAKNYPETITPMEEMSTDWESLEKKYRNNDKIKQTIARQRKEMNDLKYAEKQKLYQEKTQAAEKWENHYRNNNIWSDEKLKNENDALMKERNEKNDKYNEYISQYYGRGNETRVWQDKVEKNNLERDKKLKDLESKRGKGKYQYHEDDWSNDYYGTYEEYELKNAKVKEEKPNDLYEEVASYYTMSHKRNKLSGDTTNEDGSTNFGDKKWTGKQYTNDEFMEHLEDANWHTEKSMLLNAKLTNAQLTYIKNNTKLSSYGVGNELTGKENVEKMIKAAKEKYPSVKEKLSKQKKKKL